MGTLTRSSGAALCAALAATLAVSGSAGAALSATYRASSVGVSSGQEVDTSESVVWDVNDSGQIAGTQSDTLADGTQRSFLLVGTAKRPVRVPVTPAISFVPRVSDAGEVAVAAINQDGLPRAVWVKADGAVSDRGLGSVNVVSAVIGNDGVSSVVTSTCAELDPSCDLTLERVDPDGTRTVIATPDPDGVMLVTDRRGERTVSLSAAQMPGEIWSDSGQKVTLQGSATTSYAYPLSLGAAGQVVGFAIPHGEGSNRPAQWSPTGELSYLPTVPGTNTSALGVDSAGTIVGVVQPEGSSDQRAVSWKGGVMTDLSGRLRCGTPSDQVASLAISENGTLGGTSLNRAGGLEGMVWTPTTGLAAALSPLTCALRNQAAGRADGPNLIDRTLTGLLDALQL